jgi:hypothetical protein
MRSPNRIEHVLNAVRKIWYAYPDLRLGQIICNVLPRGQTDPYYIEDDKLIEAIESYYEEHVGK